MNHIYNIDSNCVSEINELAKLPHHVALLNFHRLKEDKNTPEDTVVWRSAGSTDRLSATYCRESFYTLSTSIINYSKNTIDKEEQKLGVVVAKEIYSKEKVEKVVNLLNILEKRYKLSKTVAIFPKPRITLKEKPVLKSSKKVSKQVIIFDSPSYWMRNSIISSIYTLYVRMALLTTTFDDVKCFRDVKEAIKKVIKDNRKDEKVPAVYSGRAYFLDKVKHPGGDIGFLNKSGLIWDYFITNMADLMGNNIDHTNNGSIGIECVMYSCAGSGQYEYLNKCIDLKQVKDTLLKQKLVLYKGF